MIVDSILSSTAYADLLRRAVRDRWAAELDSWDCEKVWHRPYSAIHQVAIRVEGTPRYVVVKHNQPCEENRLLHERGNSAQLEYEAQLNAWNHFHGQANLTVAEPLGVDVEHSLFVMEHVSGHGLEEWMGSLRHGSSGERFAETEQLFHRLGLWLRHYQTCSVNDPSTDSLAFLWRLTEPRLAAVEGASESLVPSGFADALAAAWKRTHERVDEYQRVCCHGDFGPWNVIVKEDGSVVVIDWFCQRDDAAAVDPLNVLTYLDVQAASLTFSQRRTERLKSAFCDGYGGPLATSEAVTELCAAHQKVCRLQDAIESRQTSWHRRRERRTVIRRLIEQLQQWAEATRR